jgi:hypothetical protein
MIIPAPPCGLDARRDQDDVERRSLETPGHWYDGLIYESDMKRSLIV